MEEARKNNIEILSRHNYGIEERPNGIIDLYDNDTNLYIKHFDDHRDLAYWIVKNVK